MASKHPFTYPADAEHGLLRGELTESQRNFQLALSRLVSDVVERRHAEFDGYEFQKKYGITNEQMICLAEIAIWSGEVNAEAEWKQILNDLQREGVVGSCSCCCP